jgi:UV DNA damage endonuclease
METQYGYCCINQSLAPKKISVNNSCIKRTFKDKGLPYVSSLALINARNLVEIIKWNHQNDINVYRMSSDMFPWMSEYEISDLPDYKKISTILLGAGTLALKYGQRLSFHPGPFNVLGSPNPILVKKTQKELNQHAEIMDLMDLPQSNLYPINIHCNGTYGSKEDTLARWCENYKGLSHSAQRRLVVENDDKASMYSVSDLYEGIYMKIGVPVTFDYHHHRFNDGELSEEAAFRLAADTWKVKPLFHYSSCRRTFEDPTCKPQAHADYIYEKINTYGIPIDVELECKAKDLALFKYRRDRDTLLEKYLPFNQETIKS